MIKIENVVTPSKEQWKAVIMGMRNPMNSWNKSDSYFDNCEIGDNDCVLMMQLRNAGTDHRKFMRMLTVYADVTAPLYWFKEYDTYKVATVTNSCSTMHKIHEKEFTLDDFSCEHLYIQESIDAMKKTIGTLNMFRDVYLNGGMLKKVGGNFEFFGKNEKNVWWQLIQLLPSSYNQKRTIMLNYEVLANIYRSRKGHKLDEWNDFCDWIETLPYNELITGNTF